MAEAQFSVKLHPNMINCKRFQFRLTLAWAYTVHKVQGLTLGKGGVCLQFYNQNTSNAAQGYVGLFCIKCAIHFDYIKTNPSAFYAHWDHKLESGLELHGFQRNICLWY